MTINLDINLLKKYWLSATAAATFAWTSLNSTAQQQIIHYVSVAVHQHPTLTFLAGLGSLIIADFKQSPRQSPAPVPTPAQEAKSS